MIERACEDIGLNPAVSYGVGDQRTDIELAERAGATALLIGVPPLPLAINDSEVASTIDLWQAMQRILDHSKQTATVEKS